MLAAKVSAVIEILVQLSCRGSSCSKLFVRVVQIVAIDAIDARNLRRGLGEVVIAEEQVVLMGSTSKVIMVMMTFLASLHREACSISTRDFLLFVG